MKWRLQEGNGEAIYEIGVEDNGILTGLNESDLKASLSTLEKMAKRLVLRNLCLSVCVWVYVYVRYSYSLCVYITVC